MGLGVDSIYKLYRVLSELGKNLEGRKFKDKYVVRRCNTQKDRNLLRVRMYKEKKGKHST